MSGSMLLYDMIDDLLSRLFRALLDTIECIEEQ